MTIDVPTLKAALRDLLNEDAGILTRSAFTALSPRKQSDFCRNGGTIVDDPQPGRRQYPRDALRKVVATRAEFRAMSHEDRATYMRLGLHLSA